LSNFAKKDQAKIDELKTYSCDALRDWLKFSHKLEDEVQNKALEVEMDKLTQRLALFGA